MARGIDSAERGKFRRAGRGAALALIVALVAGPLGGCSDRMLDTGPYGYLLGDGPPPDEPGLIRPMTGEKRDYPNLATVPPRPTDIRPLTERQADIESLRQVRDRNRGAAQAVREDPRLPVQPMAVQPMAVPPPAVITPGQPSQ